MLQKKRRYYRKGSRNENQRNNPYHFIVKEMIKLQPNLIQILKSLSSSSKSLSENNDYDIGGINDPFLQIKILKALRMITRLTDETPSELNDLLAQIATNTENSKNVGNAILYELVKIIISNNSCEDQLRIMAINIIGKLLLSKDNNNKYISLLLIKMIKKDEYKLLERHKLLLVSLLKDNDKILKKMAVEVVFMMINNDNIKIMTKELLSLLLSSNESEIKREITDNLLQVLNRFCKNISKEIDDNECENENIRWILDTYVKIMCLSKFINDNHKYDIVYFIYSRQYYHEYACRKLFFSMRENINELVLLQVGLWSLGEYCNLIIENEDNYDRDNVEDVDSLLGDGLLKAASGNVTVNVNNSNNEKSGKGEYIITETSIIGLLRNIIGRNSKRPNTNYSRSNSNIQNNKKMISNYMLNCILKLYPKFKTKNNELLSMLSYYLNSNDIELQQRACEYQMILKSSSPSVSSILEAIPMVQKLQNIRDDSDDEDVGNCQYFDDDDSVSDVHDDIKKTSNLMDDLLDLEDDDSNYNQNNSGGTVIDETKLNSDAIDFGNFDIKNSTKENDNMLADLLGDFNIENTTSANNNSSSFMGGGDIYGGQEIDPMKNFDNLMNENFNNVMGMTFNNIDHNDRETFVLNVVGNDITSNICIKESNSKEKKSDDPFDLMGL